MIELIIQVQEKNKAVTSGNIVISDGDEYWVKLDIRDEEIVLCKSFSDLTNPANIEAGYSLNVQVPFTRNNNEILCDLYKIDSDTLYNAWKSTAVAENKILFNPTIKTRFKLLSTNEVIYEGSMVMDDITVNEGNGTYNVTLYDEMYDIFSKLNYELNNPAENYEKLPSTFPDDKFININSLDISNTPSIVKNDWELGGNYYDWINGLNDNNYYLKQDITNQSVIDVVGFVPTYRTFDNFNYDGVYITDALGNSTQLTFKDDLQTPSDEYPSIGQLNWKFYHLKPYLYYHSYLQFLFSEIYRVTGYKVDYRDNYGNPTSEFFSLGNVYWTNLIYTCNYLINDSEERFETAAQSRVTNYFIDGWDDKEAGTRSISLPSTPFTFNTNDKYKLQYNCNVNLLYSAPTSNYLNDEWGINKYNKLHTTITISFRNASNQVIKSITKNINYTGQKRSKKEDEDVIFEWIKKANTSVKGDYVVAPASLNGGKMYSLNTNNLLQYNNIVENINSKNIQFEIELTDTDVQQLVNGNVTNYITTISHSWDNTTHRYFHRSDIQYVTIQHMDILYSNVDLDIKRVATKKITIPNLLGHNYNVLDGFTTFLKQFNLLCVPDYVNKTIKILQRGEYYKDKNIVNWSKYINTEKQTPTLTYNVSDSKELIYTYEDRDDEPNTASRTTTGYNDSTVIYDVNEINNDSTTYLNDLYNSDIRSKEVMFLADYRRNNYNRYLPTIPIYNDNDGSGEALDEVSGQLLFRNNQNIPYTWMFEVQPRICTDTPEEIADGEYYNVVDNTGVYSVRPNCYPNISKYFNDGVDVASHNDYSTYFENLKQTDWVSEWDIEGKGIYNNYFARWNDLVYNNTKKLSAEYILPMDKYKNFQFSDLITIDNNIYLPLSMDEYAMNNNNLKADLLQIRSLTNLDNLETKYDEDYFIVTPQIVYVPKMDDNYIANITWFSNKEVHCERTQNNVPSWCGGVSKTESDNKFRIVFAVRSTGYPNTQDMLYNLYDVYYEETDDLGNTYKVVKHIYFTNIPADEIDTSISINPVQEIVTNSDIITQQVNIMVNSIPKPIVTITTTPSIVATHIHQVGSTIKIDNTHWLMSFLYNTTSGIAGEKQRMIFNNGYNTATFEYVRGEKQYGHQTLVNCHNGNNPQLWSLFFTDYEELATQQEEFEFDITCNYDWESDWYETLYDKDLDEYPFNPKEDWYLEDVNTGKYIYPGDNIGGYKGTTYTYILHYSRKYQPTNPLNNSVINIHCLEGHTATDDVQYTIKVVATTRKNTH